MLWMVPRGENLSQEGFIRATNLSDRSGTVTIWGIDDEGRRSVGTATMTLAARQSRHFTARDLERGNPARGLVGSLDAGRGDWRLVFSTDLDVLATGFVRTPNGFLTTMQDVVAENSRRWRVPMFNPARNPRQVSALRLVNPGVTELNVTISGIDDAGRAAAGGRVTVRLPPRVAIELSAQELESGSPARGLSGRLGEGVGKWVLDVEADGPMQAMSLLRDPNGYLTNLSTATRGGAATLDP
jgi:hypothetical protein